MLSSFGPLGGVGLPGPGRCGGASPATGGSSAGGTSNPVLFAAGLNHRPDSPAAGATSAVARAPPVAALPMPAVPAALPASPTLPASPGLSALASAAFFLLSAPNPPAAGDAKPGPSGTSGADRKATSASVNSVPVFVPALPSPATLLSPAALPAMAASPSWPFPGVPPASAMPSSGPSAQVMSSTPSPSRSVSIDLPLPSSVAGRRDGTRLKYRSGRALRTNTRVARK
jgi:hypothetical protein